MSRQQNNRNQQQADIFSTEISSQFLADLKSKAQKATHGPWHKNYDPQDNMIEGRFCEWVMGLNEDRNCPFIDNPLLDAETTECMAAQCGAKVLIKEEDLTFMCAANPAVILALISKIEELQRQNFHLLKCLEKQYQE